MGLKLPKVKKKKEDYGRYISIRVNLAERETREVHCNFSFQA